MGSILNVVAGVPHADRLRDRRRGHHGLFHGRRPADLGVGQRRAARGQAGRLRARRCRSRCAAGGWMPGTVASCSARPGVLDNSGGSARRGLMSRRDRAGVHRLARAAAEDLRRARRSRGPHRRRPERARPVSSTRSCRRCSASSRARSFRRSRSPTLALPMILMHGAAAARRRASAWPPCSRPRSAPPTPCCSC